MFQDMVAERSALTFASNLKRILAKAYDAYGDRVNIIFDLFEMADDKMVYEIASVIFEILELHLLDTLPELATRGFLHKMYFWHFKNVLDRELNNLAGE